MKQRGIDIVHKEWVVFTSLRERCSTGFKDLGFFQGRRLSKQVTSGGGARTELCNGRHFVFRGRQMHKECFCETGVMGRGVHVAELVAAACVFSADVNP